MSAVEQQIFRSDSTTYYWSTKFFPRGVREDVFKLYSFVRTVDDYVDKQPQQKVEFRKVYTAWQKAMADPRFSTKLSISDTTQQRIIKNIIHVSRAYSFDPKWIEAFFDSMQMDLNGRKYKTIDDTLAYIYGSAEVIGLMMAKILGLPKTAHETARLQGRAMQYINFIRDIAEDVELGRSYFPSEDLKRFGLTDLTQATAYENRAAYTKFIRFELARYHKWQREAETGLGLIPGRLKVPIKTAVDMYDWTARRIGKYPLAIYTFKIRPTKRRVLQRAVSNLFR
jgi:phytoene synthase